MAARQSALRWNPAGNGSLLFTGAVVSLVLLLPISALVLSTASLAPARLLQLAREPVARAAYRLTFEGAAIAALVNGLFGTVLAWVLVRFRFPGRSLASTLVDLPLALPTAVAGITLSEIYTPARPLGAFLQRIGLPIAFSPPGVILAMTFVSLPFVVRTVQPVLAELESEIEEAAHSLGASGAQTFVHVILPSLWPAILSGLALSFARAVGEYGSVVLISGNIPFQSLTAPVLIFQNLEQSRGDAATVTAMVLLVASLAVLLFLNGVQRWRVIRGA